MTDDGPIRVFVGSYDLSATDLTIPADVLRAGDEAIAAERQRRREAEKPAEPVRKSWLQRLCAWMMCAWMRSRQ